jgi:hypothetical protein
MNSDPNDPLWFVFLFVLIFISVSYWIPTLVAFLRNHTDKWYIFLVNLALGGTVIGWIAALVWSFGKIGRK